MFHFLLRYELYASKYSAPLEMYLTLAAEESAKLLKNVHARVHACRGLSKLPDGMMGFVVIVTRARKWRSRSLEFCAFLSRD